MRTKAEVSADKLRGGFYSPEVLVDLCLTRSRELLRGASELSVLEPSAGDGAFLRGIARTGFASRVRNIEAVELVGEEAAKAASSMAEFGLPGRVVNRNVLEWSEGAEADYDLVLGNPPYVRFQFISDVDKQRAKYLTANMGVVGTSVSNLWIPVFLLALSKLREGGAFSVILPSEFLTGISASVVRQWLIASVEGLTIDLFKPGSFPDVLQEVVVVSGRISCSGTSDRAEVRFVDHNGGTREWWHSVHSSSRTWTSYLLTPNQNRAFMDARSIAGIQPLRNVARFSVSTVTGANGYFCVDSETVKSFGLTPWAISMLPRSRHAAGLILDSSDMEKLESEGSPVWMLSFSADKLDPVDRDSSASYIDMGEALGISARFKCRVRTPWYRVPVVPAGELLLSKRSNHYPRVISNHAGVVTTDTIYRGSLFPGVSLSGDDFTAGFHNSLTMLSAEIEGRSFGGGVLELVPSEVSSLLVPVVPGLANELDALDRWFRGSSDPEGLIRRTDGMLSKYLPELGEDILEVLSEARSVLVDRRLRRCHSQFSQWKIG